MSEFKVIKCRKCDAPLTELEGEKLTKCVQCGYKFIIQTNSTKKQYSNTNNNSQATTEIASLVNKLRQVKSQKNEENISDSLKPMKSIGINIVKWWFILIISMGVLSQCFNR